jgi:hypothetical protein
MSAPVNIETTIDVVALRVLKPEKSVLPRRNEQRRKHAVAKIADGIRHWESISSDM